MSKEDIIDDLLIKHDVWQAGYTRTQLEGMTKKKLKEWLEMLDET